MKFFSNNFNKTHGEYIRGDFKKNRSGMTRGIVDEEDWEKELFGDDEDRSQVMKKMDVSANKDLGPPSQHLSGKTEFFGLFIHTFKNRRKKNNYK